MPIQFLNTNGRGGFTLKNNSGAGRFSMSIFQDADSQAFFARVTAAGGTLSGTEQTAINNLVTSLKANNLWDSMLAIYPMVGASAAACAQNLKSSSYTGTFSGGWTFASTGATPNGTNAYMSMGFVPSTALASVSSNHLSYYSRTQNFGSNAFDWGTYDGTNEFNITLGHNGYSNNKLAVNYAYPSNAINAANNTSTQGFLIGSRTSTTSLKLYYNNTTIGTSATTLASSRPTSQMWLGAENSGGPNYSPRECAFASIGNGLSDTDANNLYTVVQAFQTSLSRQV
jgi:hypothetical protein